MYLYFQSVDTVEYYKYAHPSNLSIKASNNNTINYKDMGLLGGKQLKKLHIQINSIVSLT